MPAGDPADIFRPDARPAWIEAAQVVAFFYFQHNNLAVAIHNNLAEAYLLSLSGNKQIPASPVRY